MKKNLFYAFLSGIVLHLLVFWTRTYHNVFLSTCIESVSIFALTMYWLDHLKAKSIRQTTAVTLSVVLGYFILLTPLLFIDPSSLLYSLVEHLVVLLSAIGAAVYFNNRKYSVLLLLMVIWILLNTVCHQAYIDYFHAMRQASQALN